MYHILYFTFLLISPNNFFIFIILDNWWSQIRSFILRVRCYLALYRFLIVCCRAENIYIQCEIFDVIYIWPDIAYIWYTYMSSSSYFLSLRDICFTCDLTFHEFLLYLMKLCSTIIDSDSTELQSLFFPLKISSSWFWYKFRCISFPIMSHGNYEWHLLL